jgi:hypothetical protein
VDPAKLRCGGSADDLAVALSGLDPTSTWVTRQSLQIPATKAGADWALAFTAGPAISPTRVAKGLDLAGCGGNSSTTSTSSGAMSTSGVTALSSGVSSSSGLIFEGVGGANMSGGSGSVGGDDSSGSGSFDATVLDTNCGCSGTVDTSATSTDSTTSSDSCDGSSDTSSGTCSGDTSSSGSCSGDTSGGDACDGSSSSGESCGSSGGDTSCDSGGGDLSCGSGSGDCSVASSRGHKRSGPRFSVLALALVALIAPLRRRGRRARKLVERPLLPMA